MRFGFIMYVCDRGLFGWFLRINYQLKMQHTVGMSGTGKELEKSLPMEFSTSDNATSAYAPLTHDHVVLTHNEQMEKG